jgi:RNA polymerase sigma-70 factor, ECF subfamily
VLKLSTLHRRPTSPATADVRARPRPSDPEIVAGLTRGESWAAEELYDRIQPYVERTLRRVLRYSGAEFEDLVQASFERIIRVLSERSLGGACDLPTWSSAVAAHVALDALRRRVRERKLFRNEPAPEVLRGPDHSPERSVEARFDVARVQGIFGRMKAKHAEAIVLHDVLGHDLNEIAVLTGVSVAAAQSRLVRGRKELLRRARGERRGA